jgi:2-deoxy-D-gluconate 3-dehydrogenase
MSTSVVEMFSLAGSTTVITGGTRGIGAEMAVALAEAGSDIVLIQVLNLSIPPETRS